MIESNIRYGKPLRISSWRKMAIGTWRTAKDPSVYGVMEIECETALQYIEKAKDKTGSRITITHFVGRAIAEIFKRHPEINCVLRWGRLYPREDISVFFQVATDKHGKDLSGMVVRNADLKSIVQIASEMEARVAKIRTKGDLDFGKMKNTARFVPGILAHWMLNIGEFFFFTLNWWLPAFGVPKDAFGGVMVTNIGSLGLDYAFAPLVPYSRVPILITLGSMQERPVVSQGKITIQKVLRISVTFDHRLIDGIHAAKMAKSLESIFKNPAQELGEI